MKWKKEHKNIFLGLRINKNWFPEARLSAMFPLMLFEVQKDTWKVCKNEKGFDHILESADIHYVHHKGTTAIMHLHRTEWTLGLSEEHAEQTKP